MKKKIQKPFNVEEAKNGATNDGEGPWLITAITDNYYTLHKIHKRMRQA